MSSKVSLQPKIDQVNQQIARDKWYAAGTCLITALVAGVLVGSLVLALHPTSHTVFNISMDAHIISYPLLFLGIGFTIKSIGKLIDDQEKHDKLLEQITK